MPKRHVLIVSNTDDAHARVIFDRLIERSIQVTRLDSDIFTSGSHRWRIPASPSNIPDSSWFNSSVDVVWYRRVEFPVATDAIQSFIGLETEGLFNNVLAEYRHCKWVNQRDRIAEARPKIAQLQRARSIGFRIPDTLVTNSVDEISRFAALHCHVVAKPVQAQVVGSNKDALVIGTRTLAPEYYESAIRFAPGYLQEKLAIRSEIRVVVFGQELHAFRLRAQEKVDDLKQLKLSNIDHELYELDEIVSRKIHSLMLFYGLEFGAIDLAIIDDGEPVFLELNPNGQWLWLQYMTGENLIDPFIDMLCS